MNYEAGGKKKYLHLAIFENRPILFVLGFCLVGGSADSAGPYTQPFGLAVDAVAVKPL